jgi:hypothetical protein
METQTPGLDCLQAYTHTHTDIQIASDENPPVSPPTEAREVCTLETGHRRTAAK